MPDVLRDYAPLVPRVETEPDLDDLGAAIALVASGNARSVTLVNLRDVEALLDSVATEALRAGVIVRIDRTGGTRAIVVSRAR